MNGDHNMTRPASSNSIKRRTLLTGALSLAGVLVLPVTAVRAQLPADAPTAPTSWPGGRSTNGWPVLGSAPRLRIEGSEASFNCASGDVAEVLTYTARRFNYEAMPLRAEQVRGHRTNRYIETEYQSNLLSGTAVDLLGSGSPAGASGTLEPAVVLVIRDILAQCQGVLAWGGDMAVPLEGFFQIDVAPQTPQLAAVAASLRVARIGDAPGSVDVASPARRQRSREFAHHTKRGRRR